MNFYKNWQRHTNWTTGCSSLTWHQNSGSLHLWLLILHNFQQKRKIHNNKHNDPISNHKSNAHCSYLTKICRGGNVNRKTIYTYKMDSSKWKDRTRLDPRSKNCKVIKFLLVKEQNQYEDIHNTQKRKPLSSHLWNDYNV